MTKAGADAHCRSTPDCIAAFTSKLLATVIWRPPVGESRDLLGKVGQKYLCQQACSGSRKALSEVCQIMEAKIQSSKRGSKGEVKMGQGKEGGSQSFLNKEIENPVTVR